MERLEQWLKGEYEPFLPQLLVMLENVQHTPDLTCRILKRMRQYENDLDKWAYYVSVICPGMIDQGCCTGPEIREELLHIKKTAKEITNAQISPVNPYFIQGGKIRLFEALEKC